MQVPNGELNAEQLRFMGSCIKKYGDQGCGDITTRAAIQLRGITLEVRARLCLRSEGPGNRLCKAALSYI